MVHPTASMSSSRHHPLFFTLLHLRSASRGSSDLEPIALQPFDGFLTTMPTSRPTASGYPNVPPTLSLCTDQIRFGVFQPSSVVP
ncbi:hypothetical protein GCK72_025434 [Caenorhabditis remanei]|uniref:Uncharacterized protein n=1 Tax=Caenorhabditis remanei TaxID=31234 RepID=A0A6A5G1Y3_CAERE|nr:hypothetical protein GCK72_025434 [Caenorhabditis remanei]KAF1748967.1 hypothetical protein GCK72_025434 [Caenorhabditis remanei]